jgi:hypothetical protein
MGMGGQRRTPGPLEKDWVPIVQEAGWAIGPVWAGAENLAPTGIRPTYLLAGTSRPHL